MRRAKTTGRWPAPRYLQTVDRQTDTKITVTVCVFTYSLGSSRLPRRRQRLAHDAALHLSEREAAAAARALHLAAGGTRAHLGVAESAVEVWLG